jgi:cytochrome c6
MTKRMRSQLVLALVVAVAGSVGFAQSGGEAVYKANCQSCHGSSGTPNPGIAKSMGVKPANDPEYKSVSEADMIAAVKNGKGKMKAFGGKLTDAQIKDSVEFFRSLAK